MLLVLVVCIMGGVVVVLYIVQSVGVVSRQEVVFPSRFSGGRGGKVHMGR
jgi:hypothetical protein